MADKIAPCLFFDGEAEEAARFYTALMPGSAITAVSRYGEGAGYAAGTALLVEFTLADRCFQAVNGGPMPRSAAVSFSIEVEDQAELDRLWSALTAEGGSEGRCGWLTDRYGFAWQVVPRAILEMHREGGPGVARMMAALMTMTKLDVAALEAAYRDQALASAA